jgi:hypothetical protein
MLCTRAPTGATLAGRLAVVSCRCGTGGIGGMGTRVRASRPGEGPALEPVAAGCRA